MKFVAIKPKEKKLVWIDADTLTVAELSVGLDPKNLDDGILWRDTDLAIGLGYFVAEYGFFVPPDKQSYAIAFGKLIAGTAMVYAFNEIGDTIPVSPDMISEKDIEWLPTQYDVEIAIAKKIIQRPVVAVNGVVKWRWPEPQPTPYPPPEWNL